jgi:hypothetical protein
MGGPFNYSKFTSTKPAQTEILYTTATTRLVRGIDNQQAGVLTWPQSLIWEMLANIMVDLNQEMDNGK